MADLRDDALLNEYLDESREHLADIEADLLAIEGMGAAIDEALVNKVFRAAHSIKGGAGFFALRTIQELSHKLENVLDLMRSRQMTPTSEGISLLLRAFDRLRELVSNGVGSNQADVSEYVAALTTLASTSTSKSACPSQETQTLSHGLPIAASAFDLDRAKETGQWIYLVTLDLIHDIQRVGKTPLDVLREIGQCGEILNCGLDLTSAGTLDDEPTNKLLMQILVTTVLDPSIAGDLFHVSAESIKVVQPFVVPETIAPVIEEVPAPAVQTSAVETSAEAPGAAAPTNVPVPTANKNGPAAAPQAGETSLRVSVHLLESLMTLAGELVLSRNQLVDAIARNDLRTVGASGQRINVVTSELQEAIMQTRMQPVGNIFAKFPRLVRDLARDLGKEIDLQIDGKDVEMDKTIIEGLGDPLTHMVRNAVDHGVENPETRRKAGKRPAGAVRLKAYHAAGQVVVELSDDGKGIDGDKVAAAAVNKGLITKDQAAAMSSQEKVGLIFLPGLSTAEKVTGVSGRGVGMDVVKTNIDRLGGHVEIETQLGQGSTIRIKLPLTLAIIPSLLISVGKERFAIPQVNVDELIRVPADQIHKRIQIIGDARVLLLRGKLIPVVELSGVLKRGEATSGESAPSGSQADLQVVVVTAGANQYGLVVDQLHDTVEIVVKPLGRHLKSLREYAGATILGDGRVALILDVLGVAAKADLLASSKKETAQEADAAQDEVSGESHAMLMFRNAPDEQCAVPLSLVQRVEQIHGGQVERIGGRRTMQYRGASLPLVCLSDVAKTSEITDGQDRVVIVFQHGGREIGLLAAMPVDVIETSAAVDHETLRQPGVMGSAILKDKTTLIVDIYELVEAVMPQKPAQESQQRTAGAIKAERGPVTLLLAEDSDFFRNQVKKYLEGDGYCVLAAPDGQAAWDLLEQHAQQVSLVVTDIEMPNMTGLELTKKIRSDQRTAHLPVIAVTSLAGEDDIAKGKACGVTDYQVKLDKDSLLQSVRAHLGGPPTRVAA